MSAERTVAIKGSVVSLRCCLRAFLVEFEKSDSESMTAVPDGSFWRADEASLSFGEEDGVSLLRLFLAPAHSSPTVCFVFGDICPFSEGLIDYGAKEEPPPETCCCLRAICGGRDLLEVADRELACLKSVFTCCWRFEMRAERWVGSKLEAASSMAVLAFSDVA